MKGRRLTNFLVRASQQRPMLLHTVTNGFPRGRSSVLATLAWEEGLSERHTRAMGRVFARFSFHCDLHRVSIYHHSSASVHLLSFK